MVKVHDGGVWLVNTQILVADDAEARAKITQMTGAAPDRNAAAVR